MNYTNKNKLLYIAQYLYECTDDEHPATSKEIIEFLDGKGISINRHTLPTDIDALQELGVDVITINSMPKKYFVGSRRFELPELKLLVDAVDSAKFITPKKSKESIGKLTALTSTHRAEVLNRHTYVSYSKTSSEDNYCEDQIESNGYDLLSEIISDLEIEKLQQVLRNLSKNEYQLMQDLYLLEKPLTVRELGKKNGVHFLLQLVRGKIAF